MLRPPALPAPPHAATATARACTKQQLGAATRAEPVQQKRGAGTRAWAVEEKSEEKTQTLKAALAASCLDDSDEEEQTCSRQLLRQASAAEPRRRAEPAQIKDVGAAGTPAGATGSGYADRRVQVVNCVLVQDLVLRKKDVWLAHGKLTYSVWNRSQQSAPF